MVEKVFEGVYREGKRIYTINLTPGKSVYGERLVNINGKEYREWIPFKSKLSAAIKKGLKTFPFKKNTRVLYLGCATGTTPSHISDIITEGLLLGVDLSPEMMARFLMLCRERENLLPFLGNASFPEEYEEYVKKINPSVVYQDIAQRNQIQIFEKNLKFLKRGYGLIAIKAKSISSTESVKKVLKKAKKELEKLGDVVEFLTLEPFEKDHAFAVVKV